MDQFDDWRRRISEAKIDGNLQTEIADKILDLLKQKKDSISALEEKLFVQAITGLSINVNSICQPTEAGLNECLIALRTAIHSEDEPDDSIVQSDDENGLVNYGRLVATVENIRKQIL